MWRGPARREPKAEPKPAEKADKPNDKPKPEAKSQPKIAEKSQPKPEPKAEPKPAEKADKPNDKPKPDQVADELKKDEAKKTPKPEKKQREFKPDQTAEELKKDEAKKQRPSPKIDADQVAALLDHREPQRQVATAELLNSIASLGAPLGQAAHLSQSELYALRAKLISLWNPPAAVSAHPDQYVVSIRIRLARNHRLVGQPVVLTRGHGGSSTCSSASVAGIVIIRASEHSRRCLREAVPLGDHIFSIIRQRLARVV